MLAVDEKYRKRKIGKILKSLHIACNTYMFWTVVKYWNSRSGSGFPSNATLFE
jgi:hypothetical protein